MTSGTWLRLSPALSGDDVLSIRNVVEALGYKVAWNEGGYYLVTHREPKPVAQLPVPHRLNPVRTRPFWAPDDGPEVA